MIGMILRNMRLSAHLSQRQLGKLLHLADTTISSYERENSQPDFETIMKIANTCNYQILFKSPSSIIISPEELSKEQDF